MHTVVVSDIHLSDAEPPHPSNPLWKRYKRPKFFVDSSFRNFLHYLEKTIAEPIELVLNGDIFDFDSVMAIPKDPGFKLSWLERARGLATEEKKSAFKISVILEDHPIWVEALQEFLGHGHHLIFVMGNHDVELHWPTVRERILAALDPEQKNRTRIRFCEWFYISNEDTLIEHGNQYDSYNLCSNPINPLIRKGNRIFVRTPFGNLAGKFMLNGMGLMNPHAESSFIKNSAFEYFVFYLKYVFKVQPLLLLTWFWSAMATLIYSLSEGFLPAMTDPLTIHSRVEGIAGRANAHPSLVWSLRELHSHPAIFNPLKILRELWLDRAIMLALIVFVSLQFFGFLNLFATLSVWWFIVPVAGLLPMFIFYARTVKPEVAETQRQALTAAPLAARLAGVSRTIQGHTHIEGHCWLDGIEYLNTGTWSPAFHDVECTQPFGRKCFAWIRPGGPTGRSRIADLLEWDGEKALLVPPEA